MPVAWRHEARFSPEPCSNEHTVIPGANAVGGKGIQGPRVEPFSPWIPFPSRRSAGDDSPLLRPFANWLKHPQVMS